MTSLRVNRIRLQRLYKGRDRSGMEAIHPGTHKQCKASDVAESQPAARLTAQPGHIAQDLAQRLRQVVQLLRADQLRDILFRVGDLSPKLGETG